jgi:hypothetical protein
MFLSSDGLERPISYDHIAAPCRKAAPRLPAAALSRDTIARDRTIKAVWVAQYRFGLKSGLSEHGFGLPAKSTA